MGGPGKANGFVSQETSVSRELWECSLVYKWEQRGIKVWFAFSHLSAFMAAELWASWTHLSPAGLWKWRGVSVPWMTVTMVPACGPCAAHTSWPHTQQGRGQLAGHSLGQDAWEAVGSHLEGPWEQLLFWKAWPLAHENRKNHLSWLCEVYPLCSNWQSMSTSQLFHPKLSSKLPPSLFNQTLAFFFSQWLRQGQQPRHKVSLSLLWFHYS